jgi:hypothetical protein
LVIISWYGLTLIYKNNNVYKIQRYFTSVQAAYARHISLAFSIYLFRFLLSLFIRGGIKWRSLTERSRHVSTATVTATTVIPANSWPCPVTIPGSVRNVASKLIPKRATAVQLISMS